METNLQPLEMDLTDIRRGIRELCQRFPDQYWREIDRHEDYPSDFVDALIGAGWLSILIPRSYGGGGLGISAASIVLEEVNASGGSSAPCHAQMYTMAPIVRHGTQGQKKRYLPEIAVGNLRLQAFAITEPDAGSDTTSIATTARREGDGYVINGQKIFTSRLEHSDLMLLLARTTPLKDANSKTDGLGLFIVDLREAGPSIESQRIPMMINHPTYQLFIRDLFVPRDQLIGEEGRGFTYLLDCLNAERILLAAESVGDGRWFCHRAADYASERRVFGRLIGENQGVQFPLARAYADVEAADLMRQRASQLFDEGHQCGPQANMAKLLASEAAWEAANACMDTYGGYGFAKEYDIERKFRETRLYQTAPVTNNLILAYIAQHVLNMPRSY